jgi:hypothetical protein
MMPVSCLPWGINTTVREVLLSRVRCVGQIGRPKISVTEVHERGAGELGGWLGSAFECLLAGQR